MAYKIIYNSLMVSLLEEIILVLGTLKREDRQVIEKEYDVEYSSEFYDRGRKEIGIIERELGRALEQHEAVRWESSLKVDLNINDTPYILWHVESYDSDKISIYKENDKNFKTTFKELPFDLQRKMYNNVHSRIITPLILKGNEQPNEEEKED